MITAPEPALYWTIFAIFASLVIGSIIRFIALRNAEEKKRRQRLASLRTWWMLATFVSAGLLAGRLGICLLLTAASCIAWFEITRMFGARSEDRLAIRAGYALIVSNYLLILLGQCGMGRRDGDFFNSAFSLHMHANRTGKHTVGNENVRPSASY